MEFIDHVNHLPSDRLTLADVIDRHRDKFIAPPTTNNSNTNTNSVTVTNNDNDERPGKGRPMLVSRGVSGQTNDGNESSV